MKFNFIITILLISLTCSGQNLIVNSSFEDFYKCDGRPITETPYGWYRVSRNGAGFYQNIPGSTGQRNLECIIGSNYREYRTYWQTIMLQKLEKEKRYKISLSVATTFDDGPNLNDIGFYFTDSLIFVSGIDTLLRPAKYVGFLDSKVKGHKDYWYRIEKEFIADGNSGILVIGNFSGKDYQKIVNDRNRNSKYITIHIDDLEITPVEKFNCAVCGKIKDSLYKVSKNQTCSISLTNVSDSIPDKIPTTKIGRVMISSDILFASNSFSIEHPDCLEFILTELNKGEIKKIRITGFTDDTGTEKYNKDLSLKRAQSVASYLSDKFAISSMLIESEGAGISTKYSDKKLNRRVEVYVYRK